VKREEGKTVNYKEWERSAPREITDDSLWKMEAYRLGLFIADVGWHDVTKLMGDKRTLDLSDQLYRALGSISANLTEGYSRAQARIARVSTSMPSVQPGKAVIGTTRAGTYLERPSSGIA
jgi:hypothetical protein